MQFWLQLVIFLRITKFDGGFLNLRVWRSNKTNGSRPSVLVVFFIFFDHCFASLLFSGSDGLTGPVPLPATGSGRDAGICWSIPGGLIPDADIPLIFREAVFVNWGTPAVIAGPSGLNFDHLPPIFHRLPPSSKGLHSIPKAPEGYPPVLLGSRLGPENAPAICLIFFPQVLVPGQIFARPPPPWADDKAPVLGPTNPLPPDQGYSKCFFWITLFYPHFLGFLNLGGGTRPWTGWCRVDLRGSTTNPPFRVPPTHLLPTFIVSPAATPPFHPLAGGGGRPLSSSFFPGDLLPTTPNRSFVWMICLYCFVLNFKWSFHFTLFWILSGFICLRRVGDAKYVACFLLELE